MKFSVVPAHRSPRVRNGNLMIGNSEIEIELAFQLLQTKPTWDLT